MAKEWFKVSERKPPVNVPVLCRMQWYRKYEPVRKDMARYHYEVHWIMEDGGWDINETLSKITEWQFITYNGKQVEANDDFTE